QRPLGIVAAGHGADDQYGNHRGRHRHNGALDAVGRAHQRPDDRDQTAHQDTGHAAGGRHLLGEEGEQDRRGDGGAVHGVGRHLQGQHSGEIQRQRHSDEAEHNDGTPEDQHLLLVGGILADVLYIDVVGQVGGRGEQIAVRRGDDEGHAGAHHQRTEGQRQVVHRYLEDHIGGNVQGGIQLGCLGDYQDNADDDQDLADEHADVGLLGLVAVFGRGEPLQHVLVAQHQGQGGQEVAQQLPAGHTAGNGHLLRRQSGALRVGHADQEGNRQEEAADHQQGADGVGIGHRHQTAAHGDDGDQGCADGQGQAVGDLNPAGSA
ncbi:DNA modification methylase, partial [Dysosmobacter welbionis]